MKKGLVFACILLSTLGFSRDENTWKEEKTVEKQFSTFKENLKFYGGYFLLTDGQLKEFQKSLSDSIDQHQKVIEQNSIEIKTLQKDLKAVQVNLASTKQELDLAYTKVDSFDSIWGQTSKGSFSGIMYTTTVILLIVIGFVAFLYYRSNSITLSTTKELAEIEAEFEEHRKKSLEKEMKLNRELQTERNKTA